MPIRIDPNLVNSALPLAAGSNGFNMNVCKMPSEGFRALSISVPFPVNAPGSYVVSPQPGSGGLTQVAAVYCQNPLASVVTLLWPDTGYQIDVAPFESACFPVISTGITGIPKFYIILRESGGANIPSGFTLLLLNQYIPSFTATAGEDIVVYDSARADTFGGGGGGFVGSLTAYDITHAIVTTIIAVAPANNRCILQIQDDNSVNIFELGFVATAIPQSFNLLSISGLDIADIGNITFNIIDIDGNLGQILLSASTTGINII